jgi:two-component system, OmpR family, phosphate regulon response regulator PhoB
VAREFLEYVLRQEGISPIPAADGEMALNLARHERPDLVLLNVMMPFMDGFEVLRRLKESPDTRAIPVIMLTACTGDADTTFGFEIGAADYVEKPYSITKLLARIRKVLRDTGVTTESSRQWPFKSPCAKSNCYPRRGYVVPKGVLPDGCIVFRFWSSVGW